MFGDDFMLALAVWREARGEGPTGMQAVACVIQNPGRNEHLIRSHKPSKE